MPCAVCNGAILKCMFGAAPMPLTVLPTNRVIVKGQPVANMMDFQPFVNVKPFATCMSMLNPAVVAAQGVPQPCTPIITSPWQFCSFKSKCANMGIVTQSSKLFCQYGGIISVAANLNLTVQAN